VNRAVESFLCCLFDLGFISGNFKELLLESTPLKVISRQIFSSVFLLILVLQEHGV
jgi:hypothetical protein